MQLSCNCCATVKIVAEPFQITSKPSKMHHKLQNANGWSPNPTYDWKISKTWSQHTHNTHTHTTHAHSHTYTQGRTETSTYIHTRRHTDTHINTLDIFTHTSTYTHIHTFTHTHTHKSDRTIFEMHQTRQPSFLFAFFLIKKWPYLCSQKNRDTFFLHRKNKEPECTNRAPALNQIWLWFSKIPSPLWIKTCNRVCFMIQRGGRGIKVQKNEPRFFCEHR